MLISTGKSNIVFSSTQLSTHTPHSFLTPFPYFLLLQQSYFVDSSIFDKGLNLPRPEVVPFRLTPNMLDAFGPTGADGIFKSGMESSLDILRKNRDTLLSVLEPFIKDPVIDWKKQRTQQSVPLASTKDESQGEAKRSIKVIKERLSGICNLRNPNYRRLRGIIPQDVRQRVEQDNMMKDIIPLSVEGQVQKLCTEASKNENLVQLYVGWMPWI